ncbi:MAG TPA: ABC transporter permease [Acidimicrobiia bacterium]|nr:ABC transporter permease [Acidimicrobiia bacterium]
MRGLWWEFLHHTRVFWRVPVAAFFTVAFPLMFLVLFNLLNSDASVESLGGLAFSQFFTPAIAVFSIVTACYTNLVITTSMDRDEGILKRVLGTPLPPATYIGGRVLAASGVGLTSVAVMLVVGVIAFDVRVIWSRLPLAILILFVGAACWAALALAVASVATNGQAAPAVANATILPLAFISGIFFPVESGPAWLATVAGVFPLRPFVAAFSDQWNPLIDPSFPATELGILLVWGAVGAAITARRFSWEPGRRVRE